MSVCLVRGLLVVPAMSVCLLVRVVVLVVASVIWLVIVLVGGPVSVAVVPVLVTVVRGLIFCRHMVVASVVVLLVVTAVGWLGLVGFVPGGLGDGADESDDEREGELGPTVATHLPSVVGRDHDGVGDEEGAAKPRGRFDGRPHGTHAR